MSLLTLLRSDPSPVSGCTMCPYDGREGLRKIFGESQERQVCVWVQSPSRTENASGRPLSGAAGKWFWTEAKRAGFKKKHCDVEHVLRCWPAERIDGRWQTEEPSADALRCCSEHTRIALGRLRANIWLVLGKVAAKQLFGRVPVEPMFQHQGRIRVFALDHPAYLMRDEDPSRTKKFRELLGLAAEFHSSGENDRFEFLRRIRLRICCTASEAEQGAREVLEVAKSCPGRLAIDEESAVIDGRRVTLCVGFCPQPGHVWVFVLQHPGNEASDADRERVRRTVTSLLDAPVSKTMHNGVYDDQRFLREFGVSARSYDYDTRYGAYLAEPVRNSFSLASLTAAWYPRFSGYKDLTLPEAAPPGSTIEEARASGAFYLERVPLRRLAQYNACDCHLTASLERDTASRVSEPLVRVYTEAAFVLESMNAFGPWLDFDQTEQVERLYPILQQQLAEELRQLAKNPELNPNSYPQMQQAVYRVWKLPRVKGKMDTSRETLKILLQTHPHPGVKALQDYRQAKTRTERIAAFRRSAEAHEGRVTTYWWLTGTRTGRLSSGGGSRGDKRNLGNLQNIPSDKRVKNMLVSDPSWRAFANTAVKKGTAAAMEAHRDIEVFAVRDYSQMELRILAQMSGEKAMIRLFQLGEDVHSSIGALWSGYSREAIQTDSKIRRMVKGLHFGVIYGLSAAGLHATLLAQGVQLPLREVEGLIRKYWARFPAVVRYRERQAQKALRDGYVENLFGFRVPIDTAKSGKGSWWRNQAVNAPIQGAGHQVLLNALALLHRHPDRYACVRPQMEIHDSLVCVTSLRHLERTVHETEALMERDVLESTAREFGIRWKVPFVTDLQIGFRYGGLVTFEESLECTLRNAVRQTLRDDRELADALARSESR